jgi:hypothetical protein
MSERKNFLYNLGLFGFTSLLFVSYSIIFGRHILKGLSSDVWDELGKYKSVAPRRIDLPIIHS